MNVNPNDPSTPIRSYLPLVTNSMKWWLAIFLGILFFLIALGGTYNLTNAIWTGIRLPSFLNAPGCPNTWGVLIHAIVFVLLIRLILW
jgi:heme A synthase